jgi:hypothetical protein
VGEKIKADKILNREIAVLDYKIEQSKYEGKGQCIHMQIMVGDDKRVLFISGKKLMEALVRVHITTMRYGLPAPNAARSMICGMCMNARSVGLSFLNNRT